jgi:hypothetical protein
MLRSGTLLALALISLAGCTVQLRNPKIPAPRTIEPKLFEPTEQEESAANASPLRLLDTQARGHIGRRLLHQEPNGELIEDPVWQWSSTPDRFLDVVLRFEVASKPGLRLVDAANAPTLAATLLVWDLESKEGTQLVGAVEFQFTGLDRVVYTQIIRASEPVSAELPGNLASAASALLDRLASQGVRRMVLQR